MIHCQQCAGNLTIVNIGQATSLLFPTLVGFNYLLWAKRNCDSKEMVIAFIRLRTLLKTKKKTL